MTGAPSERWERLGRLLAARRGQIDPRYVNRSVFASEVAVNAGILRDIEVAARTNFTASTLGAVEMAYRLDSGAIDKYLSGAVDHLAASPATSPAGVAIPEDAEPHERAELAALQNILASQQAQIDQLRTELEELKRARHEPGEHGNGDGDLRTA